MNKKIYFAGSIRGGRDDAELYKEIIAHIKETDIVLTEHIGDLSLSLLENGRDKDALIYEQDTNWLKECDAVIAECTSPSLGVGYELAYAEKLNKPCFLLYRKSKCAPPAAPPPRSAASPRSACRPSRIRTVPAARPGTPSSDARPRNAG